MMYNSPASTDNNINDRITSSGYGNQAGEIHDISLDVNKNLAQQVDSVDTKIVMASKNIPNYLTKSGLTPLQSDIKDFLSRPVLCPGSQVPWTTALARGTQLMRMSIPDGILTNTMFLNKLSGTSAFKATLVFKFQTNAQKFQQGMVLITYIPNGPQITSQRLATASYIWPLSQMPSVRHNIADTNETEVRIPFSSVANAWSQNNDLTKLNYGYLQFTVYSPCVGGDVPYKCWCFFDDLELFYPTAHSGRTKHKVRSRNIADEEDEGGIISGPVDLVSRGISKLGNNVPFLKSVTDPPAWFLDSLSKGLASFGFSNPISTETRSGIVPRIASHPNNCDANDTLDSHALFISNKLGHLDGFAGKDFDELSIQYLTSIPTFSGSFTFATTNAAGVTLLTKSNGLQGVATSTITTASGAKTITWHNMMGYCGQLFQYWRGSIRYKFYAVKTTFHTGRILFVYSASNSAAANTYGLADYNTRYIWDISKTSVFEIEVPYISPIPWATTFSSPTTDSAGTLKAYVLTELLAPSTVSSSIEIIYEMSAGEDFELAVPANYEEEPVLIQSGETLSNPNYKKFKQLYNMDSIEPVSRTVVKTRRKKLIKASRLSKYSNIYCQSGQQPSMGGVVQDRDTLEILSHELDESGYNAMYTIGEVVKSLRLLLKRSCPILQNIPSTSGLLAVTFSPVALYYAYCAPGAGVEVTIPTSVSRDYFNFIGSMFSFYRGSMIVRSIPAGASPLRVKSALVPNTGTWAHPSINDPSITISTDWNNVIYSQSEIQGAIDVHIPFYSRTHSKVPVHLPYLGSGTQTITSVSTSHNNLDLAFRGASTSSFVIDVTRQTGDDFSFGGFIGVMPVCGQYGGTVVFN